MNSFQNGINKIVGKQTEESNRILSQVDSQLQTIKSRLASMLLSSNTMGSDEARTLCIEIFDSPQDTREQLIHERFGPLYAEKSQILLNQIATLENEFAKLSAQSNP